jgi:hypothetical protein
MKNIKATLDLSNSKNRCQIKPSDAFAVYFIQHKAEGISESVIPELNKKNQISVQKRNRQKIKGSDKTEHNEAHGPIGWQIMPRPANLLDARRPERCICIRATCNINLV